MPATRARPDLVKHVGKHPRSARTTRCPNGKNFGATARSSALLHPTNACRILPLQNAYCKRFHYPRRKWLFERSLDASIDAALADRAAAHLAAASPSKSECRPLKGGVFSSARTSGPQGYTKNRGKSQNRCYVWLRQRRRGYASACSIERLPPDYIICGIDDVVLVRVGCQQACRAEGRPPQVVVRGTHQSVGVEVARFESRKHPIAKKIRVQTFDQAKQQEEVVHQTRVRGNPIWLQRRFAHQTVAVARIRVRRLLGNEFEHRF